MGEVSRRAVLVGASAMVLGGASGATAQTGNPMASSEPASPPSPLRQAQLRQGIDPAYAQIYGPVGGEPFPVRAVDLREIDPAFWRTVVPHSGEPGSVIVDPDARYLYFVQGNGRALRYGVGVGREGFGWTGVADIRSKQEWPDWYPPKEMIARQPEIRRQVEPLQSGLGVPGGSRNPLGARALYLWQGNKDTLFRIHGTLEPHTIGKRVSSGCIRMMNQDAIHLYARVPIGTPVTVLGGRGTV